ncbi:MAG: hypothetical protein E4H05_01695, partial [Acidimicrobiales bacterium]
MTDDTVISRATRSVWSPIVVVLVPFVVAAIRLATRTWYPVLDLAMTEFRVRDVGGANTPLIGLPGRIGTFPDQGSHPGPLGYYLLAPVYRLFGASAVGLLVGAVVIGAAAAVASVLVIRRMGGLRLQWAVVVVLLAVVHIYGFDILGQPWNPYLPLLPWFATLIAVWAVVVGDSAVLWVATLAGSLCAQTHLPYAGLAGSIVIGATLVVAWRWWHADRGSADRVRTGRSLAISVGVGVVCWIPVALDQLFGSQNLSMIVDYFRHPPETAIGERAGLELLLRRLDVTRFAHLSTAGSDIFDMAAGNSQRSLIPGAILLIVWAVAAMVAVLVVRDRRLVVLHGLLAVCVALGAFSMVRIFGKVWYYLTLWAWSITALVVAAVIWTAVAAVAQRLGDRRRRLDQAVTGVLVVIGVGMWMTLVVYAATAVVPGEHLSRSLGAVVGPTVDALESGVGGASGRDGTYTVVWADAASFGSQGFGMVNELERRGFDAGAPEVWRVPITEQRIVDVEDADVVVQFVTGAYLDRWRGEPRAIEVATYEPRSDTELEEFEQLRTELLDGLAELPIDADQLDALVTAVDFNLFGVQIDPAVPVELQR